MLGLVEMLDVGESQVGWGELGIVAVSHLQSQIRLLKNRQKNRKGYHLELQVWLCLDHTEIPCLWNSCPEGVNLVVLGFFAV